MRKIFVSSLASKHSMSVDEVLRILAAHIEVWTIVANAKLSNENVEMDFDAVAIPLTEEFVLSIAFNKVWQGDRIKTPKFTFPLKGKEKVITTIVIFKENVSITSDNLFVYEDDLSRFENTFSATTNQENNVHQIQRTLLVDGKTLIPRILWEKKPLPEVCDDMRVAGFKDDAIAYALRNWRGIKNTTEIGTLLRGEEITDSARSKHARKSIKLAGERYYTE